MGSAQQSVLEQGLVVPSIYSSNNNSHATSSAMAAIPMRGDAPRTCMGGRVGRPNTSFERSAGIGASPGSYFKRSGSPGASLGSHLERSGGTSASPGSHFERSRGTREPRAASPRARAALGATISISFSGAKLMKCHKYQHLRHWGKPDRRFRALWRHQGKLGRSFRTLWRH